MVVGEDFIRVRKKSSVGGRESAEPQGGRRERGEGGRTLLLPFIEGEDGKEEPLTTSIKKSLPWVAGE